MSHKIACVLVVTLSLWMSLPARAQAFYQELYRIGIEGASSDSLEMLSLDSLQHESCRYFIPDSIQQLASGLTAYLDSLEPYLDSFRQQRLVDRSRKRELSDLERYMIRYDILANRVRPEAAPILSKDSLYAYPKSMSKLFMPMVFNTHQQRLRFRQQYASEVDYQFVLLPTLSMDVKADQYVQELTNQILRDMEVSHLHLVKYQLADLPAYERMEVRLENDRPIRMEGPARLEFAPIKEVSRMKVEYTHWNIKGRVGFQMTQNYVSPNWSSGGQSNMSGLSSFYWKANYNDQKFIQFDNFVDMRIGFNTTDNDTLRHINIGTDQFQASSKLGIRATKNWYYSVSADLMTQMMNNYKPNTMQLKSSFLSPAKFFLSVGMDYKFTSKDKRKNLSVLLTPLTYRLNYLRDTVHFNPKSYGIDPGKKFGREFGFKVTSKFDYRISEEISWDSYLYYYSDFTYVDSEWKNTFNFRLTQYLTTQLFVHLKLDDRRRNPEQKSLIQLKEYLSFGITYFW